MGDSSGSMKRFGYGPIIVEYCLDERKMGLKFDSIQYDGNSFWVMQRCPVFGFY